jgi:hypothetical protein
LRFLIYLAALSIASCSTSVVAPPDTRSSDELCFSEDAAIRYWEASTDSMNPEDLSVRRCTVRKLAEPNRQKETCKELAKLARFDSFDREHIANMIIRKTVLYANAECLSDAREKLISFRDWVRGRDICSDQALAVRVFGEHLSERNELGLMSKEEFDCQNSQFGPALEATCDGRGSAGLKRAMSCGRPPYNKPLNQTGRLSS